MTDTSLDHAFPTTTKNNIGEHGMEQENLI